MMDDHGAVVAEPPSDTGGIRSNRFWRWIIRAGVAAYCAAAVAVGGYVYFTPFGPNRGWILLTTAAGLGFALGVWSQRHRIAASRYRYRYFLLWNAITSALIPVFCILDGGIGSPLSYIYVIAVLFLCLGYPYWLIVGCGLELGAGYGVLVVWSWPLADLQHTLIDAAMLVIGLALALAGAAYRDHEAQRLESERRALARSASVDALTGCASYGALVAAVERELARAARARLDTALLLIDIDGFKILNDSFGHAHGNRFLENLGACLNASARASDLAGRYGGDEFAVLMPATDQRLACAFAHRLRRRLKLGQGPERRATISIGVGAVDADAADADTLFDRADTALYKAKREGRDRVAVYDCRRSAKRLSFG